MDDKAPDVFEFETLEVHSKTNENVNVLEEIILGEPPASESDSAFPNISDEMNIKLNESNDEISETSNNELLILREPPQEEEMKERLTDEAISQFAQNLIDPIVKEAIEIQKAEMEESISDEIKVDSSGDKKSEKSLSDDGFEYVKDDDINPPTIMDSSNDSQHNLNFECFSNNIEDESFLNDSLKIDDGCDKNKSPDDIFSSDDFKVESNLDSVENYFEKESCLSENMKTEEELFKSENTKIEDKTCLVENPSFEDEACLNEDLKFKEERNTPENSEIVSFSQDLKSEDDDSIMKVTEDDESIMKVTEDDESIMKVTEDDESIMKVTEDDSFVKDISIEQLVYASHSVAIESDNNEDIAPTSHLEESDLEKTDEFNDDDYEFDIQGIINASNMSELPFESPEDRETVVITKSNINQKFKDIFLWKDPILSSIVLSAIMLIELGLMCDYSIISLLAYSGLLLLGSSFFYKFAVKFNLLKKCGQKNCAISITSDDIQISVDYVLKWIEYLFNEIRSLTYVVSFTKNLKAFTFFWILTYVGHWFNLLSLIFMGTITLFSLPIVYVSYEDTIDLALGQARASMHDSMDKLKSKFRTVFNRA